MFDVSTKMLCVAHYFLTYLLANTYVVTPAVAVAIPFSKSQPATDNATGLGGHRLFRQRLNHGQSQAVVPGGRWRVREVMQRIGR